MLASLGSAVPLQETRFPNSGFKKFGLFWLGFQSLGFGIGF